MTDQEKCRAVAEWLGWTESEHQVWDNYYGCFMTENPPDYLNTNESFSLLDELVKRGYEIQLVYCEHPDFLGWCLNVCHRSWNQWELGQICESKSRAIVEAILAMIEKEKADGI